MEYKDFASSLGFEEHNGIFYMEKAGFKFYLKTYETILKIKSFYVSVNEEINKEHLKIFSKNLSNNVCYLESIGSNNDTLIITLPDSLKVSESFLNACNNFINITINTLNELGYTPKTKCIHCQKEADYGFAFKRYLPIHDECKDLIKLDLEKKVEEEKKLKLKRTLLNIIYSLLIAALAFLINYLVVINFNTYITPLVLLISLGSYIGLYLSKAKNDKLNILINFLISLILIIILLKLSFPVLKVNYNSFRIGLKIVLSLVFVVAGYRIYRMFFAKKIKDYEQELKNL